MSFQPALLLAATAVFASCNTLSTVPQGNRMFELRGERITLVGILMGLNMSRDI